MGIPRISCYIFFLAGDKGSYIGGIGSYFSARNPVKESLQLKKVVVGMSEKYIIQGEIQQRRNRM